jgi:beta-glucanase (GH16 family)
MATGSLAMLIAGCGGTADSPAASISERSAASDPELVWSDEFEGGQLDLSKWKFETGATGWGNNELQEYTAGPNVEVRDGTLRITARQVNRGQALGDFTSARLNSKKSFQFGRLEVRAKIPEHKGKGVWPAIWMLPDSFPKMPWPLCGEIDIMEYVSFTPDTVYFTVHSKAHNHMTGTHLNSGPIALPDIDETFHVYGCTWTPNRIEFFLDDPANVRFAVDRPDPATQENWPFDQPFYLLLNVAVGGSWGGLEGIEDSAFPATLEIDYVRVYQ